MRTAAFPALALLLASCGEEAVQPRGEAIECAIGGGRFERTCTLERRETADGLAVTLRNAQGGFRRFILPRDDSGVRAADGAEQPTVEILGDGRVEVAVGGDRYRLPPTIAPEPRPRQ